MSYGVLYIDDENIQKESYLKTQKVRGHGVTHITNFEQPLLQQSKYDWAHLLLTNLSKSHHLGHRLHLPGEDEEKEKVDGLYSEVKLINSSKSSKTPTMVGVNLQKTGNNEPEHVFIGLPKIIITQPKTPIRKKIKRPLIYFGDQLGFGFESDEDTGEKKRQQKHKGEKTKESSKKTAKETENEHESPLKATTEHSDKEDSEKEEGKVEVTKETLVTKNQQEEEPVGSENPSPSKDNEVTETADHGDVSDDSPEATEETESKETSDIENPPPKSKPDITLQTNEPDYPTPAFRSNPRYQGRGRARSYNPEKAFKPTFFRRPQGEKSSFDRFASYRQERMGPTTLTERMNSQLPRRNFGGPPAPRPEGIYDPRDGEEGLGRRRHNEPPPETFVIPQVTYGFKHRKTEDGTIDVIPPDPLYQKFTLTALGVVETKHMSRDQIEEFLRQEEEERLNPVERYIEEGEESPYTETEDEAPQYTYTWADMYAVRGMGTMPKLGVHSKYASQNQTNRVRKAEPATSTQDLPAFIEDETDEATLPDKEEEPKVPLEQESFVPITEDIEEIDDDYEDSFKEDDVESNEDSEDEYNDGVSGKAIVKDKKNFDYDIYNLDLDEIEVKEEEKDYDDYSDHYHDEEYDDGKDFEVKGDDIEKGAITKIETTTHYVDDYESEDYWEEELSSGKDTDDEENYEDDINNDEGYDDDVPYSDTEIGRDLHPGTKEGGGLNKFDADKQLENEEEALEFEDWEDYIGEEEDEQEADQDKSIVPSEDDLEDEEDSECIQDFNPEDLMKLNEDEIEFESLDEDAVLKGDDDDWEDPKEFDLNRYRAPGDSEDRTVIQGRELPEFYNSKLEGEDDYFTEIRAKLAENYQLLHGEYSPFIRPPPPPLWTLPTEGLVLEGTVLPEGFYEGLKPPEENEELSDVIIQSDEREPPKEVVPKRSWYSSIDEEVRRKTGIETDTSTKQEDDSTKRLWRSWRSRDGEGAFKHVKTTSLHWHTKSLNTRDSTSQTANKSAGTTWKRNDQWQHYRDWLLRQGSRTVSSAPATTPTQSPPEKEKDLQSSNLDTSSRGSLPTLMEEEAEQRAKDESKEKFESQAPKTASEIQRTLDPWQHYQTWLAKQAVPSNVSASKPSAEPQAAGLPNYNWTSKKPSTDNVNPEVPVTNYVFTKPPEAKKDLENEGSASEVPSGSPTNKINEDEMRGEMANSTFMQHWNNFLKESKTENQKGDLEASKADIRPPTENLYKSTITDSDNNTEFQRKDSNASPIPETQSSNDETSENGQKDPVFGSRYGFIPSRSTYANNSPDISRIPISHSPSENFHASPVTDRDDITNFERTDSNTSNYPETPSANSKINENPQAKPGYRSKYGFMPSRSTYADDSPDVSKTPIGHPHTENVYKPPVTDSENSTNFESTDSNTSSYPETPSANGRTNENPQTKTAYRSKYGFMPSRSTYADDSPYVSKTPIGHPQTENSYKLHVTDSDITDFEGKDSNTSSSPDTPSANGRTNQNPQIKPTYRSKYGFMPSRSSYADDNPGMSKISLTPTVDEPPNPPTQPQSRFILNRPNTLQNKPPSYSRGMSSFTLKHQNHWQPYKKYLKRRGSQDHYLVSTQIYGNPVIDFKQCHLVDDRLRVAPKMQTTDSTTSGASETHIFSGTTIIKKSPEPPIRFGSSGEPPLPPDEPDISIEQLIERWNNMLLENAKSTHFACGQQSTDLDTTTEVENQSSLHSSTSNNNQVQHREGITSETLVERWNNWILADAKRSIISEKEDSTVSTPTTHTMADVNFITEPEEDRSHEILAARFSNFISQTNALADKMESAGNKPIRLEIKQENTEKRSVATDKPHAEIVSPHKEQGKLDTPLDISQTSELLRTIRKPSVQESRNTFHESPTVKEGSPSPVVEEAKTPTDDDFPVSITDKVSTIPDSPVTSTESRPKRKYTRKKKNTDELSTESDITKAIISKGNMDEKNCQEMETLDGTLQTAIPSASTDMKNKRKYTKKSQTGINNLDSTLSENFPTNQNELKDNVITVTSDNEQSHFIDSSNVRKASDGSVEPISEQENGEIIRDSLKNTLHQGVSDETTAAQSLIPDDKTSLTEESPFETSNVVKEIVSSTALNGATGSFLPAQETVVEPKNVNSAQKTTTTGVASTVYKTVNNSLWNKRHQNHWEHYQSWLTNQNQPDSPTPEITSSPVEQPKIPIDPTSNAQSFSNTAFLTKNPYQPRQHYGGDQEKRDSKRYGDHWMHYKAWLAKKGINKKLYRSTNLIGEMSNPDAMSFKDSTLRDKMRSITSKYERDPDPETPEVKDIPSDDKIHYLHQRWLVWQQKLSSKMVDKLNRRLRYHENPNNPEPPAEEVKLQDLIKQRDYWREIHRWSSKKSFSLYNKTPPQVDPSSQHINLIRNPILNTESGQMRDEYSERIELKPMKPRYVEWKIPIPEEIFANVRQKTDITEMPISKASIQRKTPARFVSYKPEEQEEYPTPYQHTSYKPRSYQTDPYQTDPYQTDQYQPSPYQPTSQPQEPRIPGTLVEEVKSALGVDVEVEKKRPKKSKTQKEEERKAKQKKAKLKRKRKKK